MWRLKWDRVGFCRQYTPPGTLWQPLLQRCTAAVVKSSLTGRQMTMLAWALATLRVPAALRSSGPDPLPLVLRALARGLEGAGVSAQGLSTLAWAAAMRARSSEETTAFFQRKSAGRAQGSEGVREGDAER